MRLHVGLLGGILLFVAAAVSGCVGGDKAVAKIGVNSTPEFDEETGAVRGQVLTDEELPIAGADAGILVLSKFAKSDENGLFAINNVPPGEYEVVVSVFGFEPQIQRVKVEAGAATDLVEFRLVQLPSQDPYHKTVQQRATLSGVMWKLTPECIYTDVNPLVKTCGGVRLGEFSEAGVTVTQGCAVCEGHTREDTFKEFTAEWQTILGEVKWTAQSGATGKGFLFDLNAPNITRGTNGAINQADPYTFTKSANKSPIAIRIDKDALGERGIKESDWNNYEKIDGCTAPTPSKTNTPNCDWFYRLFPAAYDAGIGEDGFGPDYGIMYENVAEIYITYFIKAKAEEGFTALPV